MFRARPAATPPARVAAATAAGVGLVLAATACGSGDGRNADGTWSPTRPIEIVAPAATGGGWDTLARTSARVLEEDGLVDKPVQVVNKPGGGGAIGWAYVAAAPDDPHRLFVTSPPITLVPLTDGSTYDHDDFTPIARLSTAYMAYLVPADSPIRTFGDLTDAMREDPEKVSVAGGSAPGSMDHVALAGAVNAAGLDPEDLNYVPFDGGGEAIAQALGGHVDAAVTGASEAAGLLESGDLRALAVSSPERLDTLPDVPTLVEEDVDYTFDIWRGVMGPGDMTDEQVAYYEKVFADMVGQDGWKAATAELGWTDSYLGSEDFGAFLDRTREESAEILAEVGLRKGGDA
ncbi:putative tricarboxylic transport membrane protein [Nocardiopsis mwathae]|uniref:Putative tricarboxylic transport membrane protein n=1 Tax=Nocardiopsis mwathae TaxID=1472723 RepID=A0A7W9YDN3_9ACTN|nr:tripartite tricarboxylate transporter substrate binding protein [Nocardiopsis mwathae]MBB6170199.1 putative tricarboxylic transport membrane protein [Nocardiopsis mwathae]